MHPSAHSQCSSLLLASSSQHLAYRTPGSPVCNPLELSGTVFFFFNAGSTFPGSHRDSLRLPHQAGDRRWHIPIYSQKVLGVEDSPLQSKFVTCQLLWPPPLFLIPVWTEEFKSQEQILLGLFLGKSIQGVYLMYII